VSKSTLRLIQPFILMLGIFVGGVVGYMSIEGASILNAIYMTTISVTTTGFEETIELSQAGRIFTIILLLVSWGTLAFALTRITQFVVSGEINRYFKFRRLMKEIALLHDHVIICGYGRNGHEAARNLRSNNIPFVVIEKNHVLLEKSLKEGQHLLYLEGDSTDDDILRLAGIDKARALLTTLPVDADNLFIVLSARGLNERLQIISRASESSSISKLKKAGANNVIMPDRIGGTHMATLVSKPDIVEFMDFLSGDEGQSVNIESVTYEQLPEAIKGKPLNQVMQWNRTGVTCIGIKSAEGKFEINPPEDIILYPGMKVIVIGTKNQLMRMKANLGS
jgi:voltage-gated potassium channel